MAVATKKKAKKVTPRKLTPKQKLQELEAFVHLCFASLEDHSREEIAGLTGLSLSTINRLWYGQYSLAVRFGTIQSLGAAAGLRLEMTDYKATLKVA